MDIKRLIQDKDFLVGVAGCATSAFLLIATVPKLIDKLRGA